MARKAKWTRRDVVVGLGAAALLSACKSAVDGAVVGADTSSAGDSGPSLLDLGGASGADAAATPDATALNDSSPTDAAASKDTATAADSADPPPDAAAADAAAKADVALGDNVIPPITPNEWYYITSCCGTPDVDIKTWKMQVLDRGKVVGALDFSQLQAIAGKTKEHTLECIGTGPYGQAISNAIWTGLPLLELFNVLGMPVPKGAKALKFSAADGYTTDLPLETLKLPIWLVWKMNGEPLPPNHGYPARLLVPGKYGMKNPKWITGIDFLDENVLGYWESSGWSDDATYRPNAFIKTPQNNQVLAVKTHRLYGMAYAGSDPVKAVHVRVDGGDWQLAILDYAPGKDIWVLWHFDWNATSGDHTLQARCTTVSGAMSLDDPAGTQDAAGYDGSMRINVKVN